MASPQGRDRGRFEFSVDELTRYSKFKEYKQTPFATFVSQLGYSALSAILSHQLIYALQPKAKDLRSASLLQNLRHNFLATRRPIEHTITVFSIKLCLDYLNQRKQTWTQYQIGAVSGFLSYLIGRPLDQLQIARKDILINQKKLISRFQAIGVVIQHDGFKGFYRSQNLLGPLCGTLYWSIYFGMWARLRQLNTSSNEIAQYILIPFLSSVSASLSTAIPDKLRSFSLQINDTHSRALNPVYGKKNTEHPSTSALMLKYITGSDFRYSRSDMAIIGYSVVRNWVVLSMFTVGQKVCEMRNKSQKE